MQKLFQNLHNARNKNKLEKKQSQCDFLLIKKSLIMNSKLNIMLFVLSRKNGFKSIFSPILLSELDKGINYIHSNLDPENRLQTNCFHFY